MLTDPTKGPGPQPLRTMPGSMFNNQQSTAGRGGAPLGSARLQGNKLANGSGWGFSGPMAGAPGLSAVQSRTSNAGLSSFAQTIGGGSNTPLDPSEFPSLSGTPQTQHQNHPSQAIWSNPSIRTTQHTPVQRPQGQGTTPQPPPVPQNHPPPQQNQHQQAQEEPGSAQSQFGSGVDDYRFGGQSGVGQLSGAPQQHQQPVNIEEFPPLGGGNNAELGQDRRTGMIQDAAFGGNGNAGAYGGMQQGRNGMSSPAESHQDMSERGMQQGSEARSPLSTLGGGGMQNIMRDVDRNSDPRRAREASNASFGSQAGQPGSKAGMAAPNPQFSHLQPSHDMARPSGSGNSSEPTRLSNMSEIDRFGLPGLLAMIPPDSLDHSSLAVGQDLTVLGLDLNRPDNSPLYPTFGSPFAEAGSKAVVPEYTLPSAYVVNNVPPLHSKMPSFSDETLFAIFYQHPKDVLQELAASELFNRDWRWHKKLQQWMMKDANFPAPQALNQHQERGCYIFFDVTNWRRERREIVLDYGDLDQRLGTTQPAAA